MPQIFHRSANTLSKVSIVGLVLVVGGLLTLAIVLGTSSYVTRANEYVEQPLPVARRRDAAEAPSAENTEPSWRRPCQSITACPWLRAWRIACMARPTSRVHTQAASP